MSTKVFIIIIIIIVIIIIIIYYLVTHIFTLSFQQLMGLL